MSRIRSPGYPNASLEHAIDVVEKIYTANRQNVVEREAAIKDAGYSGITGASAKMLSDLIHFGLLEKSGKGDVRVTDTAVNILHGRTEGERLAALTVAAYKPELFGTIRAQWPDGHVSEHALRSFLMRNNFSSSAIIPAMRSYVDTYEYLRKSGASESHSATSPPAPKSPNEIDDTAENARRDDVARDLSPPAVDQKPERNRLLSGERELTTGMLSKGAQFRLIVSGHVGEKEIDRLIQKLQLDKEILAEPEATLAADSDDKIT